jgi:hypothetical protein
MTSLTGAGTQCAAVLPSVCLLCCLSVPAAEPAPAENPAAAPDKLKTISTLYLVVHPIGGWDRATLRADYMEKWKALIVAEAPKEDNALCILTCGGDSLALAKLAQESFGTRAFVDPSDSSPATLVLIAQDLERTLGTREWVPYEMVTNLNSRKWTEGLKLELRKRGFTYDPQTLRVVAFGQQWTGCLTKYALTMPVHLGLANAAEVRPDLSPYAGFPLKVTYRECIPMDRHVQLFLFETVDHQPVAQFMDGLRAVWDPPHVAIVPLKSANVEIVCTQANLYYAPTPYPTSSLNTEGVVVDVADGSRPIVATLVGKGIGYDAFRAAVAKATIVPLRYTQKSYLPAGGVSELLDTPQINPDAK